MTLPHFDRATYVLGLQEGLPPALDWLDPFATYNGDGDGDGKGNEYSAEGHVATDRIFY